jgi:hypothetical protein
MMASLRRMSNGSRVLPRRVPLPGGGLFPGVGGRLTPPAARPSPTRPSSTPARPLRMVVKEGPNEGTLRHNHDPRCGGTSAGQPPGVG